MLQILWNDEARSDLGRVSGTREIVAHPNYVLVYQVGDGVLEVMRVLHARQQYP